MSEQDKIEAEYFRMTEEMPAEKFKEAVERLRSEGITFTLDSMVIIYRLASIFDQSAPRIFVRFLQVYPELKIKLSL